MEKYAIIEFFKKIHFSVIDDKYLAREILTATTKSVFLFFLLLFAISLSVSAILRTVKITNLVPEKVFGAVGVLKFQDYKLVSSDTLKEVENWRLKEFGTLISGLRIPAAQYYPVRVTVGQDDFIDTEKDFVNVGKTHFSTNILPMFLMKNADNMINISWKEIFKESNITVDLNFYKTLVSKPAFKINIFLSQLVIIGCFQMFVSILQIWISLMIYLMFFGRKLNVSAKFRLLSLTTIPYFIIMPVSLFAANVSLFATDISLVCALIITIRAITQIEILLSKGVNYEKL
jgi:hypothetical protein